MLNLMKYHSAGKTFLQNLLFVFCISFVFIIFIFSIVGCSDDSTSSGSIPTSYPSVAKNWEGSGWQVGVTSPLTIPMVVTLTQNDSVLTGDIVHTLGVWSAKEIITGSVNLAGKLSLRSTSSTVISGGGTWDLYSYNGEMSAGHDTISGTWASLENFDPGSSGKFLLVKK